MDRSTGMALEKLSKGIVAVAESIAQLQLDIAKLDARVAAVDSQVVAIGKHLDRQLTQRADENIKRDLDLERAVFGQSRPSENASKRAEKRQRENRSSMSRNSAGKGKSKRVAGRVRP